ncbi:MAG TPA: phosphodiester glycosidase family protein, partial [Deinococcales bacterium]|nr:phosphodiester glycosidase family protein [Deinococcales bacterium]
MKLGELRGLVVLCLLAGAAWAQSGPVASVNDAPGLPPLPVRPGVEGSEPALASADLAAWGVRATALPDGLALNRGAWSVSWTAVAGWQASLRSGAPAPLAAPVPEALPDGWAVPVSVLPALGWVPGKTGAGGPGFTSLPDGLAAVTGTRVGYDTSSRLVLDLNGPVRWRLEQDRGHLRARLFACTAKPAAGQLPAAGPAAWSLSLDGPDCVLDATYSPRSGVRVYRLVEPDRVVLDVSPGESGPQSLPGLGVQVTSVATTGGSSALTIFTPDPAQYSASVVATAPGGAQPVEALAAQAGAVLAVNGGYFDPPTGQAVDLVVSGGMVRSYARGDRPAFGWDDVLNGVLFGVPQVRLWATPLVGGLSPSVPVSTVSAVPHAGWVTAWAGDGRSRVGAEGFVTLVVRGSSVVQRSTGSLVAPNGSVTLSFQAKATPALDVPAGTGLVLASDWNDRLSGSDWSTVTSALAAGPTLVRDGAYAVNGPRESFDTNSGVWRPTRQVALGLDAQGRLALALLEHGSPEDFARALVARHWRQAMRLDSGTSA